MGERHAMPTAIPVPAFTWQERIREHMTGHSLPFQEAGRFGFRAAMRGRRTIGP
jgi:hypothetical protein